MMRLLAAAERGARAVGFSFNAAKCATLHLGGLASKIVGALQAARQKICKYRPLVGQLESKGYAVDLDAFIVGSLGGWHINNDRVINSLMISRRYAEHMRKLMISDTIRWSRDIYVEHVSGMR